MVRHEGSSRGLVDAGSWFGDEGSARQFVDESSSRWFCRPARAALIVVSAALAGASCGEVARTGRSPAFAVVDVLEAASGAEPDEFSTVLHSDVQTLVDQTIGGESVRVPTFFNDLGRVTFRLVLKNPGLPTGTLGPSDLNAITFTRYRVSYRRTDGRSAEGRDVPYSFDGAFTVTVQGTGTATAGFDIVRHQAKLESPLANLIGGGGAIILSTIAEVTFFGRDQAGNEVIATGLISINFGDFGDPD